MDFCFIWTIRRSVNPGSTFPRAPVCSSGPLDWPCVPRPPPPKVFLPKAPLPFTISLADYFCLHLAHLTHILCLAPGAFFELVTPGWVAIANQGQVEAGLKPLMNRGLDWPSASRLRVEVDWWYTSKGEETLLRVLKELPLLVCITSIVPFKRIIRGLNTINESFQK